MFIVANSVAFFFSFFFSLLPVYTAHDPRGKKKIDRVYYYIRDWDGVTIYITLYDI